MIICEMLTGRRPPMDEHYCTLSLPRPDRCTVYCFTANSLSTAASGIETIRHYDLQNGGGSSMETAPPTSRSVPALRWPIMIGS